MLLNEQTAVQLGDKKVLGVRQGDKFILGRHNLVPNGQGRYTSGTVEVRRNLVTRPRSKEGSGVMGMTGGPSSGWGGTPADVSIIADHTAPSGGEFITRLTHASAGTTFNGGDLGYGAGIPIALNTTYTQSIFVRSSAPLVVRPQAQFLTSTGEGLGISQGQILQLNPGEWTRLSLTASTSIETAYLWRLDTDSSGIVEYPAGTTLDFDAAMVEKSSELRPYFDGSHSPDPDLTPSWTGAENASESVLRGTSITSIYTISAAAFNVSSSQWPDYGQSIRIIPFSEKSSDSFCSPGGDTGTMRLGLIAGMPTAVGARGYLPTAQIGSIHFSARRVTLWKKVGTNYISTPGSQGPNVPGEFISELVTPLPADATEAFIRLYNGASVGNGDVYWTDVRVCQADTEEEALRMVRAPYRDGDFPGWTWDGTPGQSASRGLS